MNKNSRLKQQEWQGKIADQHAADRGKYPATPSAGTGILAKYEELLAKAAGGSAGFKALVLGSTPELRDLVHKYQGCLSSIDISLEMMMKTRGLVKHEPENRKMENLVRSDWLDNPLADSYFDVVLGDGASNNIFYRTRTGFSAMWPGRLSRAGG